MQNILEAKRCLDLARENATAYQSNQPFPHIVIDNFLDPVILAKAAAAFPGVNDLEFYQYDNVLEKKLAYDQVYQLPQGIANILYAFNTPIFLRFLEILTGIDGLIADPYYRGGGIHQIERSGKLDVHIDFNVYQKLKLYRKLNAILYLNENWLEEYGGYLELWSGQQQPDGHHVLQQCEKKILPIANRLVVFTTSEKSYHGHPEPVMCPEGMTRKSLATYYYVSNPEEFKIPPHSTTFIRRPTDPTDPEVEALREKRNRGRLSSNVTNELLADT